MSGQNVHYAGNNVLYVAYTAHCMLTCTSQQTLGVGPMYGWCWSSVVDDGWANISQTLGQRLVFAMDHAPE